MMPLMGERIAVPSGFASFLSYLNEGAINVCMFVCFPLKIK